MEVGELTAGLAEDQQRGGDVPNHTVKVDDAPEASIDGAGEIDQAVGAADVSYLLGDTGQSVPLGEGGFGLFVSIHAHGAKDLLKGG